MSKRLTPTNIKQRLIDGGRSISLLCYGNSTHDPASLWKCHKCDHEWNSSTGNILQGRGCPSCGGKVPLTPEIIKQRLIDRSRSISLLHYGGKAIDNTSLWKCHDCCLEWTTSANNILNNNTGCSVCAGQIPLTIEVINQRIIDNNRQIRLVSYGSRISDPSSQWKCNDCGNRWNARVDNILGGKGCPQCATSGIDHSKPVYVYLHTFNGFIKIGITNKLEQRHTKLDNQLINETLYTIEGTLSWYFEDGAEAQDLESTILDMFKPHAHTALLGTSFDGKTELLESSVHGEIVAYVEENYDISWV